MIVDTHLHVIDQSVLDYPWLAGEPALNRSFAYETYAAEARKVGIEASLHMEVDAAPGLIEAETDNVARLAARPDSLIVGAIAACRPEEEGFAAYLERQRANPLVKGFRRVLHVVPDDLSEGALFRENIGRLAGTGLTFDIVVKPHQIPRAIALVDRAPDVSFVLDHCGNPDTGNDPDHPWHENLAEIAKRPNVTAKVSGIVVNGDRENWTVETLRPAVEHVISSFGWDRVVWGSDWPVSTLAGGLSPWVAATHALIAGASHEERRKLLSQNARRLWKL